MLKTANSNSKGNSTIKNILIGTVISMLISIILLFNFSAILAYTRVNEHTMPIVVIIITVISILIGSQISVYKINKNGIKNGGLVGLIYILFLYLISSIITRKFFY